MFVPSAFITGISGQFYRQFALTIAGATVISLIVSLTLSPAMCALLLKPHHEREQERWWERPIRGFFGLFNRGFDALARGYGWLAARVVRFTAIMLVVYAGVIALRPQRVPQGAASASSRQLDRGYLIVVAQLPPGSSLARTDEVQRRVVDIALKTPGVIGAVNIVGFSGATFTNAPNAGAAFLVLDSFENARQGSRSSPPPASSAHCSRKLAAIQEALILVVPPPPVQGIGNAGGFRMMVEDRAGRGPQALAGGDLRDDGQGRRRRRA